MRVAARDWQGIAVRACELALLATLLFSVATAFDHLHRYLELFSHFRLQYFAASVLLAGVFVALRWMGYSLLAIAVVALNAWFVVPWFLPAGLLADGDYEISREDTKPVTLLHANVLLSNGSTARFVDLVSREAPDIIVMQEVTAHWLAALDGIKASYPYTLSEPRDDPFGIALYSKFPLDATAIVESPPFGYPDIVATAIIGGIRLNVISTHPTPPLGDSGYGTRNRQLDTVARLAARTPAPVVVIGDLNVSIFAHHYRRFLDVSGLSDARQGFGIEPTWPLFFVPAMIPIDHCLVSADIAVARFETGPDIGSDHLPILVSLSL